MSREKFLDKKINIIFIMIMFFVSSITGLATYTATSFEWYVIIIIMLLIVALIPFVLQLIKDMKELEEL